MQTMTFSGVPIDLTDDGLFTKPEKWREEMAHEIAARDGIDHLDADDWQVIRFMRERYLYLERPPSVRVVSKHCGVSIRYLYERFPKRPIKKAAKIAGVLEPRTYLGGCGVNWWPGSWH